jgi:Ca2+/Na+ antiporter
VLIKRRPVLRETGFYLASLAVLLYMIMNGASLEGSTALVAIYAVYLFVLLAGSRIKAYFTKPEEEGVSIFRQRTEDAKAALLEGEENGQPSEDEDEDQGPLGILHDYLAYPVVGPVNASAPDCRIGEPDEDKYGKTFAVSIAWLTFFSYVITVLAQRWVAILHSTANDSAVLRLFGVVLVAFAAQVPDTANSITAAKRGYGSMATSGALGSQVVNTCVGFGLPWVITFLCGKTVVLEPDPGLISQVWLMIGSCTFLLIILIGDAMRLGESKAVMTRQKAIACIVLYFLCICYSARGLY